MAHNPEELDEILPWMRDRLSTASIMLLDRRGRTSAKSKGRADLVTDADTAVEAWFLDQFARHTPGWAVVAEESSESDRDIAEGRCWVLDPLDGTVNFALGIPFFAISLALLDHGAPIAGAVVDPVRGELFDASAGRGATVNGSRLAIDDASPAALVHTVGVSSGIVSELTGTGSCSRLGRLLEICPKLRDLGSQALHLCYVAGGRLSAALSVEARLWDDAAGALIACEAGARYTCLDGRPAFPVLSTGDRMRNIAADPRVHDRILTVTREIEVKGCRA